MRQYIIRRLLQMIPVLFGVSFVIYMLFALAPGDIVTNMSMSHHYTPEKIQQLRHIYHLDENKVVQYGYWLKDAVKGNFGDSYQFKRPVTKVIGAYIWNSFYLALSSTIVSTILAIIFGVISATRQYSVIDYTLTILAFLGMSVPSFFLGLLFIKWFSIDIPIFPVSGMTSTGSTATGLAAVGDIMYHMFIPFMVMTLTGIAGLMRYTRTSVLEVIRQDYIRTARSKGLSEKVVIYKHALRNALMPIVTILGMSLPGLFSGAIITEQIFAWPGIGKITIQAVNSRDYPLLMALNMFLALLTLLGNLIADIAYAWVDPRVRLK